MLVLCLCRRNIDWREGGLPVVTMGVCVVVVGFVGCPLGCVGFWLLDWSVAGHVVGTHQYAWLKTHQYA